MNHHAGSADAKPNDPSCTRCRTDEDVSHTASQSFTSSRSAAAGCDQVASSGPCDSLGMTPGAVRALLEEREAARLRQLDALPVISENPIALAHRDAVERILADLRRAHRRLEDGLYGVCSECAEDISAERLRIWLWSPVCARCANRNRE